MGNGTFRRNLEFVEAFWTSDRCRQNVERSVRETTAVKSVVPRELLGTGGKKSSTANSDCVFSCLVKASDTSATLSSTSKRSWRLISSGMIKPPLFLPQCDELSLGATIPRPAGVVPVEMPAEVQFATFMAAFMATLEYSMEGAQAVCTNRVRALRAGLDELQRMVEVYLRRHFSTLVENSAKVCELLLTAMNTA